MPGVAQTSVDEMLADAREAVTLGIGGVLLFGIPDTKDAKGSSAWDDDGPVQRAVRALKTRAVRQLVVITDVCLCEYTDHGHCGVLRDGARRQRRHARAAGARGRLACAAPARTSSRRAT